MNDLEDNEVHILRRRTRSSGGTVVFLTAAPSVFTDLEPSEPIIYELPGDQICVVFNIDLVAARIYEAIDKVIKTSMKPMYEFLKEQEAET